jgi:hypothetical protein
MSWYSQRNTIKSDFFAIIWTRNKHIISESMWSYIMLWASQQQQQ